jgi:UTP--glucose-1-phosphate uridylyltransferase
MPCATRGFATSSCPTADNLGATCDPASRPGWRPVEIPYVAEVCERTLNDRKGGHLATRKADGRLVLRDSAMVVPGEQEFFQDTDPPPALPRQQPWVDLDVLAAALAERDGVLGLPIIVNRKTVDPTDPQSTPVIQIESAMGAAIEVFEGSRALQVPRSPLPAGEVHERVTAHPLRPLPARQRWMVQTTIDHPEPFVESRPGRTLWLVDFEERFPYGVPSMRECTRLEVGPT